MSKLLNDRIYGAVPRRRVHEAPSVYEARVRQFMGRLTPSQRVDACRVLMIRAAQSRVPLPRRLLESMKFSDELLAFPNLLKGLIHEGGNHV